MTARCNRLAQTGAPALRRSPASDTRSGKPSGSHHRGTDDVLPEPPKVTVAARCGGGPVVRRRLRSAAGTRAGPEGGTRPSRSRPRGPRVPATEVEARTRLAPVDRQGCYVTTRDRRPTSVQGRPRLARVSSFGPAGSARSIGAAERPARRRTAQPEAYRRRLLAEARGRVACIFLSELDRFVNF